MKTKPSSKLTLTDRLSRLTPNQALKLLGSEGKQLLREGGAFDINPETHVHRSENLWTVTIPGGGWHGTGVPVFLRLDDSKVRRLHLRCGQCSTPCVHQGAALSLLLEEKMTLGLAKPPEERVPLEALSEKELVETALAERRERAKTERMKVTSQDPKKLWTDYRVTSTTSGKSYRVALRGWEPGESYCTCPDFRKNTLGTCKHILQTLTKSKKRFSPAKRKRAYRRREFTIHLLYSKRLKLCLGLPDPEPDETRPLTKKLGKLDLLKPKNLTLLLSTVQKLEALGYPVTIYPDAEAAIEKILHDKRVASAMKEIRQDPANHPLRDQLINAKLLPYQLDGIAFATAAGRAILADDMGLGKTIQGIGVAEMLARETGIERVLIVCPASLKAQWRAEIGRFSGRSARIVIGSAEERAQQYSDPSFFTICNYEQVLRDQQTIDHARWDLIILDEAQRIKNWEAKTSRLIKALRSTYALVLTGTPIENRIDDLFSILEFIDDRRLGPAFRFFNRHRKVDDKGKVLAIQHIDELREKLAPVLLRRTRDSVLSELPPRTTEIVRITPTQEQAEIDQAQMQIVSSILGKPFLTEMDILRLQKALLLARMAADSTFLVNKQEPGYSSKLERLEELLENLGSEPGRKIVLFSEWTTMLTLIEEKLRALNLGYVRLDGQIPQKKRAKLVQQFQNDPDCRLFITTNAGSTGLNLQAANTVINVDLPWNPALLEQRIGRAHRMGQKRPVHVYILVTEETLEEKMMASLSAKQDLALAVLDPEATVDQVKMVSGIEDLKRRLEILLGANPDSPIDESEQEREKREMEERRLKQRLLNENGGRLFDSALGLLSAKQGIDPQAIDPQMAAHFKEALAECIQPDENGNPTLTLTLPDTQAIDRIAATLAGISSNQLKPGLLEEHLQIKRNREPEPS